MPRACVIVLDAVGAGELPDAAEYGDEGSNTLGNVAVLRGVGSSPAPTASSTITQALGTRPCLRRRMTTIRSHRALLHCRYRPRRLP